MGVRRVMVQHPHIATDVGMAYREPNEKDDLRNAQSGEKPQGKIFFLRRQVHVVLWDESPKATRGK